MGHSDPIAAALGKNEECTAELDGSMELDEHESGLTTALRRIRSNMGTLHDMQWD